MTKERIIEILVSYIDNDLESADPGYVRDTLRNQCGCSNDELKELDIYEWLGFADEEDE